MDKERRKNPRLGLGIPVRVQGFQERGVIWEEMTTTTDVSSAGACFPLGHPVELGEVLVLSLPLPARLRQFDLSDVSYRVYTLVRGVRRRAEQPRVGVMFFGKLPPRGFHDNPTARYLLPGDSFRGAAGLTAQPGSSPTQDGSAVTATTDPTPLATEAEVDGRAEQAGSPGCPPAPIIGAATPPFLEPQYAGTERRSAPRNQIFVNFVLQQVDEWGTVLEEELTVADNVGRGCARVLTAHSFKIGDTIVVQEAGGGFASRAEVRGITLVRNAVARLHLRFIDRQAPDRLLQ